MARPPGADAGPSEVRAYLVNILVHRYDASAEYAQSIADLWQLGRGSHLHNADIRSFNQIFGKPVGGYLHETVINDLYAEWRTSISGIINFWAMIIACVAAIFFLIRAWYSHSATQTRKNAALVSLLCGPILMIGANRELMRFDSGVSLVIPLAFTFIFLGLCFEINERVEQANKDREKHE
ncbi:hypothetical protein N7474_002843 [Penicillium riverlandense]|uniref:uncharacterized protein n=1 Tax=Penicillium riverlandense TaxID=1903569 RepID=UPI002546EF17|nr:uncharacterized protein N7474_002843 [Penicillium riverlandense]KAJ5825705.1 hypothetical protein N7474_002843 [Penicillium riverlandense]